MIRFITTLILAAAALAAIWILPLKLFQVLILVCVGVGLWEFAALNFQDRATRFVSLCIGLGFAALMTWSHSLEIILIGLLAVLFLSFLWQMKHLNPLPEATHRVGLMLLGVCYLGLTLPFWSWLKEMGREWVMLALFPAALTDTFGFLVGKTLGKRKWVPGISPNKTWEGFFGSLVGGVFGLWLAIKIFSIPWVLSPVNLVVIGASISLVAALGDLMESLIKRGAGVKDSSHLIPGHGGALDRLDALIFVGPFVWFLVKYL